MKMSEFCEKVAGHEDLPVWWTPATGFVTDSYPVEELDDTFPRMVLFPHMGKGTVAILASDIIEGCQQEGQEIFISFNDFEDAYPVLSVNIHEFADAGDSWIEVVA